MEGLVLVIASLIKIAVRFTRTFRGKVTFVGEFYTSRIYVHDPIQVILVLIEILCRVFVDLSMTRDLPAVKESDKMSEKTTKGRRKETRGHVRPSSRLEHRLDVGQRNSDI